MITKNFKELLRLLLIATADSTYYGLCPIRNTDGERWYAAPKFISFPYTVPTIVTSSPAFNAFLIGSGDKAFDEEDYKLEAPITEGFSMSLSNTVISRETPGDPYMQYTLTITNTGSEPITIKEIGYRQKFCGARTPDTFIPSTTQSGVIYASIVILLDRTLLDTPVVIPAGNSGVIDYKLKIKLQSDKTVNGVKIVDWSTGTDAEVAAMIDAARQGTIDLQTDGGWHVGDVRVINVAAFTGGNSVSQAAQKIPIAISSFAQYNNCGNVMQFDFMDALLTKQRMQSTNTTSGGYSQTEMYTDTLPALVNALPEWLRTRLKTFSVLASKGGNELPTIEPIPANKLALRSVVEVLGVSLNSQPGEGTQVDLYKTTACTVKRISYCGPTTLWLTRSAANQANYAQIGVNGTVGTSSAATSANAVVPFGCL